MIQAEYKDKELVIDILCKSFDQNKSVNYVVKQDSKRRKRIKTLMDYSFEYCYMFGSVYLSNDRKACALIMLPEKKKTSIKSILLDAKMAVSCVGLNRVSKILARDAKIKSEYPQSPIYYLWFIGVEPDEQQKGIGTSLLKELIKESDELKRPIYLETSVQENIRFYNKQGFNIYNELDFGYKLFLVKRDLN